VTAPFTVLEYEDARGRSEVREWRIGLKRSNPRAAAKVDWLIGILEKKGTGLQFPYVSHIEGPIYELRGQVRGNPVRLYYWQQSASEFIVAFGEVKQQGRAERRFIERALQAHREFNEE
jgi:hypothetical protein